MDKQSSSVRGTANLFESSVNEPQICWEMASWHKWVLIYQWLSARLQNLHYYHIEDAAVLY